MDDDVGMYFVRKDFSIEDNIPCVFLFKISLLIKINIDS